MKEQLLLIYSYLHGIWQYRWSALVISCVVALLGWAVVYALPNQYTSRVIMQVDTRSIMTPLLKGLAVESNVADGLDTMSRVLLSRKNLIEVIRQTDMDLELNNAGDMDGFVNQLARSIILKDTNPKKNKKKNNNNVYELSYQGDSPELVYQVVSKLLNTLIENTLDSVRTDTAGAQLFLEQQITEYESRLSTAEQKLAEFKRANIGLMPDETGGYYQRLQREQSDLENIRSELRLAERRLSEIRKQLAGETPLLGNDSYSSPQILKLRKYREQLDSILNQYTEQHPDVQALRATIADVIAKENVEEDKLAGAGAGEAVEFNPVYQELKGEMNKTMVEIETLKIRFMEKEKSAEVLKQSVDIIPEVEAKLAKLNRDYEITRERYLSLVERRESARLAQEVGQSGSNINFRIIEPPRVPKEPSGPNRLLLLTMVFFAAISAGLAWGFLRYLIQPTFIHSSQIRDKIGLPVLGSVGLFLTAEHKKKRHRQLSSFLWVFSLFVVSYGGIMVFSGPGSELVNTLIYSLRSVI